MAKFLRNEFDKSLTYDNLMKAHIQSRKGKGYRRDIILFNLKQEEYIMWLYNELKEGRYKHGGYTTFYITEPKLRKIEKSKYIDRIVHRWYVSSFMEPYFLPEFINTSYACIKRRGMHNACLDVQKQMLHCKRKWGNYYILKMDVKKYFENIDKKILYNILIKKIKDEKVMWLTKEIIYSNKGETGLPIGNYTSQFFANLYLNELDKYIKYDLKCKYYFRYMDDSIILVETKNQAHEILEKIIVFLKEKLKLELNAKTQIFKDKQGVNFCGYKINPYRIKIRDKGKRRLKQKVKTLKYMIYHNEMTSKEAKRFLAGHMGYINIADTYNLEKKLFLKV